MKNLQKGFANVVLVIVIVILLGAVGYFALVKKSEPVVQEPTPTTGSNTQTPAPTPKLTISNFEARKENGKMVLYKVYSDSTSQKTGLEVTLVKAGTYEVPVKIVVSPDKTKAVFNKWNNTTLRTEIYVSSVDGTNAKLSTQQEVGEGSGGLNQDSLAWSSDGKYITYFESQIACEAGCAPGSVISYKVTYQVSVATGEKKIISKVPDQYEPQASTNTSVKISNVLPSGSIFTQGEGAMIPLSWSVTNPTAGATIYLDLLSSDGSESLGRITNNPDCSKGGDTIALNTSVKMYKWDGLYVCSNWQAHSVNPGNYKMGVSLYSANGTTIIASGQSNTLFSIQK